MLAEWEQWLASRADISTAIEAQLADDIVRVRLERALSGGTAEDQQACEGIQRVKSYAHKQFRNPEKASCWLSCMVQSLWHSSVFHTAHDQAISECSALPGSLLEALATTWKSYIKFPFRST